MASDPGPPPLQTHEDPEGQRHASDTAVQAESPGPEEARHPDAPAPDPVAHPAGAPSRAVGGALLIAFIASILTVGTLAAFSASDRNLWWGAVIAAASGTVVGAAWGVTGDGGTS